MKWLIIILALAGYVTGVQKLSGLAMTEVRQISNVYGQAANPDQLLSHATQDSADLGFAAESK